MASQFSVGDITADSGNGLLPVLALKSSNLAFSVSSSVTSCLSDSCNIADNVQQVSAGCCMLPLVTACDNYMNR